MIDDMPDWVKASLAKAESSKNEDNVVTNIFYLMKELHLSYEDIKEMPVPAIVMLIDEMKEHHKREKKEMDKAKRKR